MTRRPAQALWAAAQWALAPGYRSLLARGLRAHFDRSRPGLWLDIGCGPRSMAAGVLPGRIVGVDVERAVLRDDPASGVQGVCASAAALPFAAQSFDGVVCFGLLHHLDDGEVRRALAEMRRVARPGATVLVFDAVRPRPPWRRPLAALLRALDRGRHLRTETALRRLLEEGGCAVGPAATYAWTGLEGSFATARRILRRKGDRAGVRRPGSEGDLG